MKSSPRTTLTSVTRWQNIVSAALPPMIPSATNFRALSSSHLDAACLTPLQHHPNLTFCPYRLNAANNSTHIFWLCESLVQKLDVASHVSTLREFLTSLSLLQSPSTLSFSSPRLPSSHSVPQLRLDPLLHFSVCAPSRGSSEPPIRILGIWS